MISFSKFTKWFENQVWQLRNGNINIFYYKIKKFIFLLFLAILIFLFFPIFLIIRIISNFFLIRFGILPSRRIGHFIVDVNLYLCNLKKNSLKTYDLFCLERAKPVSNYALLRIFKRHLTVLPEILIFPFIILNKIKYIGSTKHNIKLNPYYSGHDLRYKDSENEKIDYFSQKEINFGNSFLKSLGINENDKFVCILCRDEEYYKHLFSKSYDMNYFFFGDNSKYRNSNIDNFKLACEYLTENGYYVFRMGEKVSKPFSIKSKKFFDYASLGMRTEFLDIFLSAHCEFFLSTSSGIDCVTKIFNKPRVRVSTPIIGGIDTTFKKELTICKHFYNNKTGKNLSLSEIFDSGLGTSEQLIGLTNKTIKFEEKNIDLIENSPEEIKDAVIEMLDLMKNNFIIDEERNYLETKFWSIFKNKLNEIGYGHLHVNYFGSHLGKSFLMKNKNYLE